MSGGFDPLVVPTLIDRQKRKVVVDSKVGWKGAKRFLSPFFFFFFGGGGGGDFFFQKRKGLVSSPSTIVFKGYSLVFWGKTGGGFNGISGDLKGFAEVKEARFDTKDDFSPTAIDFGVFWASWGGSGKQPRSGNRIRVSMGSDRFCGSKVPVQKVA